MIESGRNGSGTGSGGCVRSPWHEIGFLVESVEPARAGVRGFGA